jgi:hypothetical protein
MNIDERLTRLAERHETLTQSVELLLAMQRSNEERFAKSEERFEQFRTRTEERFIQLMDAMTRLVRIVETHEHRLEDLEGGGQ